MEKKKFDLAIIGGGPAGYVAAIRAAQYKKTVALIEEREMGGTCLNRGCIPSKTLISNADVLRKIKKAKDYGIAVKDVTIDFASMKKRKDDVVAKIRKSLEKLIDDNQVVTFHGHGSFVSPNEVKVVGKNPELIEAEKILIATGSEPRNVAAFPFDYERILDSTSILELTSLPKKMAIIGSGVIGCEFASLYAEMGVDVTLVELLPRILSTECLEVSNFLAQSFKKRGVTILTEAQVDKIDKTELGLTLHLKGGAILQADLALVAVGRKYNSEALCIEKAGVEVLPNGAISANERMQTNIPHIYAIGDVTGKWLLAHVASHQGIVAADNACGHPAKISYRAVPSVTYTHPEIASCGLSFDQAKEKGYDAAIGKFPFQALGKSQALIELDGFAQIVVVKKTGQILGAQVVGYGASTLIAEMCTAIENELTVESIQETIHAHPTLSEAWLEAALLATDRPIHYPPKRS